MKRNEDPVKNADYKEARPASTYDVAAIETWLEDRAREGYRLVGFRGIYGHFDRSDHQPCRYRLKPLLKKEKAPDPEWAELFGFMGWEYVTTMKGLYHVWRCGDPSAPELDTDPVVQGEGFRYLRRRMAWNIAGVVLMILALTGLVTWNWFVAQMPLWTALERGLPLRGVICALLLVWVLVLGALDIRTMCRLLRTLRTGIPLDRPRPYHWQKRLVQVVLGTLAVYWVLCLISSLFASSGGPAFTLDAKIGEGPRPDAVYVDLEELDGVPGDCTGFYRSQFKMHELAPRMYWTYQHADLPSGTEECANTSYYHLLTDYLTPTLERDLLEWQTHFENGIPMEQLDGGELDGFWWRTLPDGRQFVIASLGRNVLHLEYQGPTDLRTKSAYFVKLLEQG